MKTIPLTQGFVAVVDEEDYENLTQFEWQTKRDRGTSYARRKTSRRDGRRKTVYMHRLILNAPPGVEVDHVNGDGLDNRRKNLRLATRELNNRNSHRRRETLRRMPMGVRKHWNRYQAHLTRGGKRVLLGSFGDPMEAYAAYLAARNESIQEAGIVFAAEMEGAQ